MAHHVTVRTARSEEYVPLANLTVAAYRDLLGDALRDPYLTELADVAGRAVLTAVLVAVGSDQYSSDQYGSDHVVGGVTYLAGPGPLAPFADPDEAGIRFLAVDPDAQGRGVGAALVAACVARAEGAGKKRLSLQTTAPMTTAQRLYERAGFRRNPGHDRVMTSGLVVLAYDLDLDAAR